MIMWAIKQKSTWTKNQKKNERNTSFVILIFTMNLLLLECENFSHTFITMVMFPVNNNNNRKMKIKCNAIAAYIHVWMALAIMSIVWKFFVVKVSLIQMREKERESEINRYNLSTQYTRLTYWWETNEIDSSSLFML